MSFRAIEAFSTGCFLPRIRVNESRGGGVRKAKMSVMSTRRSMFGDFRPGASSSSDTFSSLHVSFRSVRTPATTVPWGFHQALVKSVK